MSWKPDTTEILEHLGTPVWIYDPIARSIVWKNLAARAFRTSAELPEAPIGKDIDDNPDAPYLTTWKVHRDGEAVTMPIACRSLPREDGARLILAEASVLSSVEIEIARSINAQLGADGTISMSRSEQRRPGTAESGEGADAGKTTDRPMASGRETSLLAQVSHDMRTSIGGIIGLANLVRERIDDDELKSMLRDVADYGESLEKLTADILDISRIEAGVYRLEAVPFVPIDLVKRVERTHTEAARATNTSVRVETDLGIRNRRIGDPFRILQIMNNIVSNAVKFTADGEVVLNVRCNDPQNIRIEVHDTGVGMTADQLERVFERFVQADESISRRFGGSGLGMAIVKQLVDAMSGSIHVDSEAGVGTSVSIELPIPRASDSSKLAGTRASKMFKFDHMIHALIVDDVSTNQIVLESMLKIQEVSADIASSGAEAIDMIRSRQYDLLLIDIMMPGMSGTETLARIREIDAETGRPPAPAIAVTAHALQHQIEACMRSGFDAHIAKPVNIENLNLCMKRLLEETLKQTSVNAAHRLLR